MIRNQWDGDSPDDDEPDELVEPEYDGPDPEDIEYQRTIETASGTPMGRWIDAGCPRSDPQPPRDRGLAQ